MEFIKRMLGMVTSKPFKIQNGSGKGRVGITASSLKELRDKGKVKLNLKNVSKIVLENDGTEVRDEKYFRCLPSQTVLVFLVDDEEWDGCLTYLKLASDKLLKYSTPDQEAYKKINNLLCEPHSPELSLLLQYVNTVNSNIDAEHKDEDPEWFEGIAPSIQSKSKVMKESMKGRIRGYLWKSKEFIEKSKLPLKCQKECQLIISLFKSKLNEDDYFSHYFDRTSQKEDRLCDNRGWFSCQGAFNKKFCKMSHAINPYSSKDSRVLFSTWNLDHKVEKSREILPQLVKAIKECPPGKQVNVEYFYRLLFTSENLKLVDIRCHAKERHSTELVDKEKTYI
uniref:DNAation factor subunit beta n=1 Tax=Hydra vulgaris TaxID=6087 RepID=T2MHH7_HYDVU